MNLQVIQVSPKEFQIINKDNRNIIFETFDANYTPKVYLELLGIQYDTIIVTSNEIEDEQLSEDEVIAKLNSTFTAPGLGKYRSTFKDETKTESVYESETVSEQETEKSYEPVGDVEIPVLGNLIYVDGKDGILSKVMGGIGTVSSVYTKVSETSNSVNTDEYDYEFDDEFEYNYNEEETYNDTEVMVELEEIPGVYWNWNELRFKQTELKEKWGYKPASKI